MSVNIPVTEYKWKNVGHQYYAAITANLIMLSYGCIVGWFSPAVPMLLSPDTPLSTGPLTNEQLSWVGSINGIGSLIGILMFGSLTSFMGCKRTMLFLIVPSLAFWLLIYFGDLYIHILVARFLVGWTAGGIETTTVLYVSEIANNDNRGRLGSFPQLARNIGILISYIVGAYVDYKYVPCIFIALPIIFGVLFVALPNTPLFYLQKNQIQEAENALRYYKGVNGKSKQEDDAIITEFAKTKLTIDRSQTGGALCLDDFYNRRTLMRLAIGFVLAIVSMLTGCFTFISYAVHVFRQFQTNIDPNTSSILLAVMQIFGNLCSSQFADVLGRKFILIVSLLGSAVGLSSLASYSYFVSSGYDLSAYSWIPVLSLSFVIFIGSSGIVPLLGVCVVENLPLKIRSVGLNMTMWIMYLTSFAILKLFPILLETIALHGCASIFAVSSLFGALFVVLFVKETNGKAMDDIDVDSKPKKHQNLPNNHAV